MSDPMFQKSLQDLVKGIRSHKRDASSFISQHIVDIKAELRSTDTFVKAEAVRKLTYLQMIGYNVSWASFAIVEVMSQQRFSHKRIGYLAANQSFTDQTDVILLTTNLFKKEFSFAQSNQYELGLAINCLANIATKDLARDCISDLVGLMNHTRPYVRKKAVLAMYKLYIKYPQGLRLTFDKLKDRLDDNDSSVVSTAVNVICELSNKNPRNYLAMAPKFFRLLTTSSNNWMLIKVVKLLGSLVTEEPRLARKLLEPLATILQNTGAKSLQYECIFTITSALPHSKRDDGTDSKSAPAVIKLCSDYLRGFVMESDQNLKYLGLVGLVNLMKSHPKSVVEHRELVLRCLNDDDITIRTRALELLAGIVSRKSLIDLVHHLLEHLKQAEGVYRDEIIAKVLYMCSKEKYALVTDFPWYISILLDLAVMQGSKHGKVVADQLIEIAMKVDTVRPFAVESMISMMLNDALILGQARATVSEVLKAAAWIIGEYGEILVAITGDTAPDEVDDDDEDSPCYWIEGPTGEDIRSAWRGQPVHQLVLASLLHPRTTSLPPQAQSAYIQSAMKIFVRASIDLEEEAMVSIIGVVRSRLSPFLQSVNIEVQERASTFRNLLSEMNILSLTWKTDLEAAQAAARAAEAGSGGAPRNDLLEISHGGQHTSVQSIDEAGARAAKENEAVLAAVVAEGFYSVHPKAQRRVPVPEGLDLSRPFDSQALSLLLSTEMPSGITLATLTFANAYTPPVSSMYASASSSGRSPFVDDEEEAKIAKLSQNSWGDEDSKGVKREFKGASVPVPRNPDNDMFYLSGSSSRVPAAPSLSQALADTFDDKKSKKSKGKKEDKGSKRRSKADVELDTREMLPANAMSSDDEAPSGRRRTRKSPGKKSKGEVDLDNVDLTTPLGADEVFVVHKHREVQAQVQVQGPSAQAPEVYAQEQGEEAGKKKHKKSKDKDKEKEKGGKDDKKDKKSKKKSSGKKGEEAADLMTASTSTPSKRHSASKTDDLLGLGWGSSPAAAPAPAPAVMPAPAPLPAAASHDFGEETLGKSSKKKSGSKSSSSSSSSSWIPFHSSRDVKLSYSVTVSGTTATVSFLASNQSAATTTVDVGIIGCPTVLRPLSTSIRVGSDLTTGAEASGSLSFQFDGNPILAAYKIGCAVRLTCDSLLGSDVSSTASSVWITGSAFMTPHTLDEDGFVALLNKHASKCASASARVSFQGKSKHVLKAIAGWLRAHVVEADATKAASMCAKFAGGGYVCALAKVKKDSSVVAVDVKAMLGSRQESQTLADSLASALNDLVL